MLDRQQLYKLLHERHAIQRRFARATFPLWQHLGFHVVGDHFYDPVPNTKTIAAEYQAGPRDLPGLAVDWPGLTAPACSLMESYLEDYLRDRESFGYREDNYYFYGADALFYYALLRERRPARIVEVGQGSSTRIALSAAARLAALGECAPEIVSIDPYDRLDRAPAGDISFSVVKKTLQQVGHELPEMLLPGDLLFIDSSHNFKFGSDVQMLFERVYPALVPGVVVHIHDIFTPYDYPADWMLKRKQFWNEQYFLEVFLSFNQCFRIEAAIHFGVRNGAINRMLNRHHCGTDAVRREGASLYLTRDGSTAAPEAHARSGPTARRG